MQQLVRDLNETYKGIPALFELDYSEDGFEWIDWNDRDNSVLSWLRRDRHGGYVICVSNFTPVTRAEFRLGVPENRTYVEVLNTDHARYGGSGVTNSPMSATETACHGKPCSVTLHLPPLR